MNITLKIVVAGDVTKDWHLLHTDGNQLSGNGAALRVCCEAGGAARTAELMKAVADELRQGGLDAVVEGPPTERSVSSSEEHQTFIEWKRQGKPPRWRVAAFTGVQIGARPVHWFPEGSADLLLIDDAGLGFRDAVRLPPLRPEGWLVLKMARPVVTGALWQQIRDGFADKAIVVITATDLCAAEVQISRELSWERTAQDLFWELVHSPKVNDLARCSHVIVSFGTDGAFWLRTEDGKPIGTIFFNPDGLEGTWAGAMAGEMIGETSCLIAAIAAGLARGSGDSLGDAIQAGVAAMRRLHGAGYGAEPEAVPDRFEFPHMRVAADMAEGRAALGDAVVRDPVKQTDGGPSWSILVDRLTGGLEEIAAKVAVEGLDEVLPDVPAARFGQLLTVDRQEIESYRSIGALVAEYCARPRQKPLSIAVFGAPGSGKSFGVTQIVSSLRPSEMKILEFNLSQFDGPAAMRDALHQVRDAVLSGLIPLVFWDEFDTALADRPLGWLRHFLAPMQDGRFLEGQVSHPIGRSIFVFAGGTAARIAEFGASMNPAEFRAAKGPDFVSRLRGAIDVLGPNPQPRRGADDRFYILRRALLLRSLLRRHAPQCFLGERLVIDSGVLRAFLETREYRHGARSMEAVVTMSGLSGIKMFERSSLPAELQLDLHVDARDFMAIAHRLELDQLMLETLATAHHELYCQMTGDQKTSVPFECLPEDEKLQNRDAVRDIAQKLSSIGYLIVPARGNEPPFSFSDSEVEQLAQLEHDRWSRLKIGGGWKYGEQTDKSAKRHSFLVRWSEESAGRWGLEELGAFGPGELSESKKEEDRELVRRIPQILIRAGYTASRSRSA